MVLPEMNGIMITGLKIRKNDNMMRPVKHGVEVNPRLGNVKLL